MHPIRSLLIGLSALLFLATANAQSVPAPTLAAKAWLLLDNGSGQVLTAQDPDARIEPASLTKLMTAYVTFGAIKQGIIKRDQTVLVSENAWRTGGSKMFIKVGTQVSVDDLLHGMITQSGNDACIALAEAIAGTEEKFVEMMNREAQRLGLTGTHFSNATGLTDAQHYATVRDIATLSSALIRDYPDFYPLYSQKEFRYNNITQPNRNRLLWLDPSVDGMKTGHTEAAGYCLVASSLRGPRRLISVVVGTASDNARAQESLKLLNYGFQNFDAVRLYEKNQSLSDLRVYKGSSRTVKAGFTQDFVVSLPKGVADRLKVELVSQQPLIAPLTAGQRVGTLKVTLDGKPFGEYGVQALEDVGVAGFFGRIWDAILLFFQ
ncbi:MAG TPA: D-alanyl-D-alanine carboxypeptidase family protein [Rhodocyclaceae bacterium]|nr:D-alanyl-D-alanine carboxypeptidase family protein [Rhodocyclaceae bacterium]